VRKDDTVLCKEDGIILPCGILVFFLASPAVSFSGFAKIEVVLAVSIGVTCVALQPRAEPS
jgi:hypothetical protein